MKKEISYTAHHDLSAPHLLVLDAAVAELAALKKRGAGTYGTPESALLLPLDEHVLAEARQLFARCARAKLKYIVIIGIGGSNLGTKAVYDALYGSDALTSLRMPKLLFLDTLSDDMMRGVHALIEREVKTSNEILINLISKSGTTVESIANFALLCHVLEKRFPDIASRVVCTTNAGSALWKEGERLGYGLLSLPAPVGGRFSVFSSVGIFPLLCAGVTVEEFQEGGRDMLERVLTEDKDKNHARRSAEEMFAALKAGCTAFNIFHFNPELESLGKWERQLIAESLGKEHDLDGKVVHTGITPIVSIGSTDLHSMAQLYLGGPRDKFTMLVRAHSAASEHIPEDGPLSALVGGISGKNFPEIMDAIYGGVLAAYQKHKLPCLEVRLPSISAYVLGAYMEWRMATVLYLAKLMHVNAFDQPNVEDYKNATKELLATK